MKNEWRKQIEVHLTRFYSFQLNWNEDLKSDVSEVGLAYQVGPKSSQPSRGRDSNGPSTYYRDQNATLPQVYLSYYLYLWRWYRINPLTMKLWYWIIKLPIPLSKFISQIPAKNLLGSFIPLQYLYLNLFPLIIAEALLLDNSMSRLTDKRSISTHALKNINP